jgi:hypothetical protein
MVKSKKIGRPARAVRDHHLLTIHHVRAGVAHQWAYDVGFLAFGALLVLGGWGSPAEHRVCRGFVAGSTLGCLRVKLVLPPTRACFAS